MTANTAPSAMHLRRWVLFLDGATRAAILPIGPILLGRLLYGGGSLPRVFSSDHTLDPPGDLFWDSIAWYTATLVAAYMLGHAIGALVGQLSVRAQHLLSPDSSWFYRAVAMIVALHVCSFGTALQSHGTLVVLRLLSGLFMGLLHRTTSLRVTGGPPRIKEVIGLPEVSTPGGPLYCLLDEDEPGVCKNWLAGFAISIIISGIVYQDPFQPWGLARSTGESSGHGLTLFFFVFLLLAAFAEWVVRQGVGSVFPCLYSHTASRSSSSRRASTSSGSGSTGPVVGGILRRRRGTEDQMTLTSWNRDRLDSNNSRGTWRSRMNSKDGNRSRQDSNMSNDLFYDCSSEFPEDAGRDWIDEELDFSAHLDSIATYTQGKCIFLEDDTPAPVPPGTRIRDIPRAYVEFFGQSKSDRKWNESQRWRIEERVWKIHRSPHPWFPKIKQAYPHFCHGYTKAGYPVVYEKPGSMTLKELFSQGLEVSDMLRHYIFFMEFLSNVICNLPHVRAKLDERSEKDSMSTWGFFVVMDVTGASLSTVMSGNVLKYLKLAGDTNTNHYPSSMKRCILVNAPFWLSGVFNSMKYIVPESVQVDIHSSSNRLQGLREFIDDDQIPKEYGGSSSYDLGSHPFEEELRRLVDMANSSPEDDDSRSQKPIHRRSLSPTKRSVDIRWAPDDVETGARDDIDDLFETPRASRHRHSNNEFQIHDSISPPCNNSKISLSLKSNHDRVQSTIFADECVVITVSIMHGVWCAIQGSLETALPLWLLSPTLIGGLGYEPVRAGLVCFIAALVLILLSRTRISRRVSQIPAHMPMKGYRWGVGAEAFLLTLIALIPSIHSSVLKKDSWLIMSSNVLIGVLIFVASVLGRSSSAMLHREAMITYLDVLSLRFNTNTALGRFLNTILWFLKSGHFTYTLGVAGEISGALVVARLFAWSTYLNRPFPLDAAFFFFTGAITCIILHIVSFSIRSQTVNFDQKDSHRCLAFGDLLSSPVNAKSDHRDLTV